MKNVKSAKLWLFFGALIASLIWARAVARAQPASGTPAGEGRPAASDAASTSGDDDGAAESEDDSILVDDPKSPWSQGTSAEDRRAARAMIREGTRLYLIPLYAKAAEQYTAALGKWKHPGIYYNLALTQRNLGREDQALENLELALKYGEKGLGPKRFREAQKQLADIKRMLGRLRVVCKTPGAEVTLDGVTLFTGPGSYEGWVKAKSHELTAKKVGYLAEARRVTVASDQLQEVELKLVTLNQAADASRRWAVWKPWSVVIAGGVIAAAGGGVHAFSRRDFRAYDSGFGMLSCAAMGCTEQAIDGDNAGLNAKLSRAQLEQKIAVGGYIAGGAIVVTGAVLLYMNRPRVIERESAGPRGPGVAMAPLVSGDTLGVLVTVSH